MSSARQPVPPDLYRRVEAEAGSVLPVTRWRRRPQFLPDWDYICSPAASADAVVAALYCTEFVYEENWARALEVHAPRAMELLAGAGCTLRQYRDGELGAELLSAVGEAISDAFPGYEIVVTFPTEHMLACSRSD